MNFREMWNEAKIRDRLIRFMDLESAKEVCDMSCIHCKEQLETAKALQKQGYKIRAIVTESFHIIGIEVRR